ncbi:MAG: hypothetical protein IPK66_08100 [Rhodospirillales bacterium]|nr:hypothetical protein [Rhodospirillales bacterium]
MTDRIAQATPVRVAHIRADEVSTVLTDDRLLAMIGFGETRPSVPDARLAWVPLAVPESAEQIFEAWFGSTAAVSSLFEGVVATHNGEVLFGHLHLDDSACGGIETATVTAYHRLLACARDAGYPHLLRVWHFFANIHAICGDLDRYQAFCRGRFAALAESAAGCEMRLPAASALGSHVPGLTVQFLACRGPGLQIENPRQVSAFRYPERYAPRSPSFSRSVLLPRADEAELLLISGTASIVGHQSRHEDDPLAQLGETIDNLDALLAAAASARQRIARFAVLRAYLRIVEFAPFVREVIAERLGADLPVIILAADICRPELHIEIEGLAYCVDA